MRWIAGVDGCRGGWVAAFRDLDSGRVECTVERRLAAVLDGPQRPMLVAIDIPIGLVGRGDRLCDREARRLLGRRACTVFPAPIRPVLGAASYQEANALAKRIAGKGLPVQAFGLVPKIAEADREVRTRGAGLLREAHPELAFGRLNGGQPIGDGKKSDAGRLARRSLLAQVYRDQLRELEDWRRTVAGVAVDDLYDALAVLETARRLSMGQATTIPGVPPRDALGIPMEIVY